MMRRLRSLIRLLSLQASFTFERLQGVGMAVAEEPLLESLGQDQDHLRAARGRSAQYFNAHPFLAGIAAGALARAELDHEDGRKFLRISTPIGPLTGMDAKRCLRFNWEQRMGYLAVSDLDGSPYLQLCENRPYDNLVVEEIDLLIAEMGPLGDRMEQAISAGGDAF